MSVIQARVEKEVLGGRKANRSARCIASKDVQDDAQSLRRRWLGASHYGAEMGLQGLR